MDFLIINGEVVSKNEANLTDFVWDEPFILTQKVWFGYGGIPHFQENLQSIKEQLKTLNLPLPDLFKNKRELFRLTKRILNKNKFYRSGFVHYQFFVVNKNINYLIASEAFETFDFPFLKQGLLVTFSSIRKNSTFNLGRFKYHNNNLWNAAKAEAQTLKLGGSILLNEKENICEGIASNVFMVKDGVLVTPSLETGCYNDMLRTVILQLAKELKLKTIEVSEIVKEHLLEMDEVFFASEELGIQWILGVDKKRFVHVYSEKIYNKLNFYLKSKVIE